MIVSLMYHDIITKDDRKSGFQNESAFQYKVIESEFKCQVEKAKNSDCVFTFDDGGVSFITKAAPILEEYGRRGIFFISTKYIGTPGFLTEEQIKDLDRRGHIIGSHSHTHPDNITLLSYEDILYEWSESLSILQGILGKNVNIASIPNGYDSKYVVKAAVEAGIAELYTSKPCTSIDKRDNIVLRGRYVVDNSMKINLFLDVINNKYSRVKLYLRWWILNLAKMVLGNKYNNLKTILLRNR